MTNTGDFQHNSSFVESVLWAYHTCSGDARRYTTLPMTGRLHFAAGYMRLKGFVAGLKVLARLRGIFPFLGKTFLVRQPCFSLSKTLYDVLEILTMRDDNFYTVISAGSNALFGDFFENCFD